MTRQGLSPNYFTTNEVDIRLIQSVILHIFPVILNMRSVQLMETIIKLINQKYLSEKDQKPNFKSTIWYILKKNECSDQLSNTNRPERPQKIERQLSRSTQEHHWESQQSECKYMVFKWCKPLVTLRSGRSDYTFAEHIYMSLQSSGKKNLDR